ncbi:hypothetical protein LWI28_018759 [Acer negundo]|uniref:DYW domain-containing protein n=1 Tax=Acer negundo TaxID=4023 RepID=A0AAD5IJT1_ACENE|nr:hypothetical protein LWI28_018759 [Acer negundo]
MIEQTGENKTKNEKNDKKYIDVSVGVNAESAVCANDEANAEEIDTEIGDCAAIRTVKPKNRLHGKLYGCFNDEDDSPEDGNIGSIVDPDVIEEGKPSEKATAILTACRNLSYAGQVDEGKSLSESMEKEHNLKPTIEHYGFMVDLLGRAGLLKEAKQLIDTMPIGVMLVVSDPDRSGRILHLANIYAIAEEWDKTVEVRRQMTDQRVCKLLGCSSISLNGILHEFVAGDTSNPQMNKINDMGNRISKRLKQEGYQPATEEKETAIHQNSDKLAVAFALIRTKSVVTIRIIKNLWVCEDGHTVEIVMWYIAPFHNFKNGKCSCRDYR